MVRRPHVQHVQPPKMSQLRIIARRPRRRSPRTSPRVRGRLYNIMLSSVAQVTHHDRSDRPAERKKAPASRSPAGVNVSSVGLVCVIWRGETVALHALETGLLDVDLHRLTSRRSRRAYLRAVLLCRSDCDAILSPIVCNVASFLCLCAWHEIAPLSQSYDITFSSKRQLVHVAQLSHKRRLLFSFSIPVLRK